MPLRDAIIRLGLNAAPYVAGIKQAQAATGALGANITRTAAGGSKSASVLGSSFGLVGLAAGAAAVKMISAAADFDQGMSNVKATGADAVKNIGALRQAAIEAGNATKYSATEAAAGVEALAKAGVSSASILGGGLKGALNLAAAGNLDVAGSAEAAASAMNQFGLAGKDVPHIADLLAAGAGKAQGEVSDMAMALNQAGLIAHGAGASIEETTGTLAAFASAGLTGSDAGTSFKTMLQRLQAPTDRAAALMKKYNVSLYDGKGKYQGLSTVAGQLRTNMAGLSEKQRSAAFAIMFGTDAVRGANVLYEQGQGGIKNWTAAVDDAGFAADVAAEKQNNLKGDLEKLKGTLDTLFIEAGDGTQGPLRDLTQGLDDLLKKMREVKEFNSGNPWLDPTGAATDWLREKTGNGKHYIWDQPAKKQPRNSGSSASVDRSIELTADISDVTKQGALADKIIDHVLQDKPAKVNADPKPAKAAAKQADSAINGVRQRTVPKITADAGPALEAVRLTLSALAGLPGLVSLGSIVPHKAAGGPIAGPGSGTSDDVPIMASNGEHMWTARETQAVGGHRPMLRLRAAALSGSLPAFASGGPVGMSNNQWKLAIAQLQADMADNRSQLKTTKGVLPRRVLQLEYNESKAALRRLRAGVEDDPFSAVRDAIASPVGLFDSVSDSPWQSGNGGFAARAQSKLTQIKTFAGKLRALKKAGLSGAVLSELASLGSVQGINAADELLREPSSLRSINSAYASIQATQGYVAALGAATPPGVHITFGKLELDAKSWKVGMEVIAKDQAGNVVAQESFYSTVNH